MTIYFEYEKGQVMQALRYHFISRPEIKTMLIVVNVFALLSITLYAFGKITPMAFLVGSTLWIVLMISFWFILPFLVYRRAETFQHSFSMNFEPSGFTLMHARANAVGFYEKMGYKVIGDEFIEVTIPHYVMEKRLY